MSSRANADPARSGVQLDAHRHPCRDLSGRNACGRHARDRQEADARAAATPSPLQAGAGAPASIPDTDFVAAGATLGRRRRHLQPVRHRAQGAPARRLPSCRCCAAARSSSACCRRTTGRRDAGARPASPRFAHGAAAAHHARAVDGRALVAGQHRRLQGGDRRGRRVRPLHADADDRRRHGQGGARADPRRRRRRAAGHRDRQAARRRRSKPSTSGPP